MKKLVLKICLLVLALCCASGITACADATVNAASVTLDKTEIALEVGETQTLNATVLPDNTTNKTVYWSVNDDSIVSVDNGTVTALAEGTATVTATVNAVFATCTVTVKRITPVENITFNEHRITLPADGEATLTASVYPENATSELVWSVEPEGIVSVNGGKLTALSQGTATVTATADGKSDKCTVIVTFDGLNYQLNEDGQSYSVIQCYSGLFTGENELTEITVAAEYNGKPVTAIGEWAFGSGSLDNLKRIVFPASVVDIERNSLYYCHALESIEVDADNPVYSSVDGILYNKAVTESVFVPYNIKGVISIPSTMTVITGQMFQNRKNVTGVTIHDGITAVGEYAFADCDGLVNVELTDNITVIGSFAFSGCTNLTNITLPGGLTNIEGFTFSGCTSLTDITLPGGLTNIKGFAFSSCSSLTNINFSGTKAQWEAIEKGSEWSAWTGDFTVHCTDGDIN